MGYAQQEFLDFFFNEHWLSEFGMVVVSNGDRLPIVLQPQFENQTTTILGKDSSLYWGTQKTSRSFDIVVASEGMTSRQVESFKRWLQPGNLSSLIFSQTPYKNCLALVGAQTTLSCIPFATTTTKGNYTVEDTLYKGDATINFVTYDVYDYIVDPTEDCNFAVLDNITDSEHFEPPFWWIQSGIPLQTELPESGLIFLGNGYRGNSTKIELPGDLSSAFINVDGTLLAFNAGSIDANTNLMFNRVINIVRDVESWIDITFISNNKVATINQPRILKDIKYTLALLSGYNDTTFAADRVLIQKDLMDNLDGVLKRQIIGILRLTGVGMQWQTLNEGITAIENLVSGKVFTFSLNGLKQQCILHVTTGLWSFGTTAATLVPDQLVEENFGDVFSGSYIQIAGTLDPSTFTTQSIVVTGGPINNIYINYKYTYA